MQIAKALGADVTAVCSPKKMDMVRSLGADHVIDYTQADITQTGRLYKLILDAAAYRSVFDYLPTLTPDGTYVLIGGSTARFLQVMLLGLWISRTRRQQVKCLASKPNQADLVTLRDFMVAGKIASFIGQRYNLSEVPVAIRRLEHETSPGESCHQYLKCSVSSVHNLGLVAIGGLYPTKCRYCLTTPMHTDHRELIGYEPKVICGG